MCKLFESVTYSISYIQFYIKLKYGVYKNIENMRKKELNQELKTGGMQIHPKNLKKNDNLH